ncbi:MAG TPA: VacJ family lipoprotein [Xanthomonadaceae bacterium]|nr:VacJ family lipoprotein [Xanthomonadaceae bacterium]
MTPLRLTRAAAPLVLLLLAACAGGTAARKADAPVAAAVAAEAATPSEAATVTAPTPAGSEPAAASAPDPAAAEAAAQTPAAATTDEAAAAGDPLAPTQAEQDYAALYGNGQDPYNPVADPSLPSPADLPSSYDPWEPLNRRVHAFNNVVDRTIARPLAQAYVAVVPRPVRLGVGNFFNNLGQPVSALNALLQGRPGQAGLSLARFTVNSTLGLAGIFDPATKFNIPNRSEDFGQTLGVWGWKKSRYVELPLFGPRTVRDVFGLVGDSPMAPLQYVEQDKTRVFLQGLQLVDVRTQLMAVDSMREGAADEYALFRDAWMQRRAYQIFGDRERSDEELPDYLQDDTDPYVPVDVMPVVPGGPGGPGG